MSGDWQEELHPRGEAGKFASKDAPAYSAASRIARAQEKKERAKLAALAKTKAIVDDFKSPSAHSKKADQDYQNDPKSQPMSQIPAGADLAAAESHLKGLTVEHAAVYDGDGNMLCRLTDHKKDSIPIPAELRDEWKARGDVVFTHNHPTGAFLSGEDLAVAIVSDLREMRAVRPSGETIVMSRPEGGWPRGAENKAFADDLNPAFAQAEASMKDRMDVTVVAAGGKPWEGTSAKGYSNELWYEFRFEEAHKYLTPVFEKHGIRIAIVPPGRRPGA